MGVLTASGSGSVWLTVITSCLLRPLRLDFFWVSLVMSCESAKGEQIIHRIKGISVNYRNWSAFDRSFHVSIDYMYIQVWQHGILCKCDKNALNGIHETRVNSGTWWWNRFLEQEVTGVICGLSLSFLPSDEELINKKPFPSLRALQEVAHILLNLFSFFNGQNVSGQQGDIITL